MKPQSTTRLPEREVPALDQVLAALPAALVVIDGDHRISLSNPRAEELFCMSAGALANEGLAGAMTPYNSLTALIEQVRRTGHAVTARDLSLDLLRRREPCIVDAQVAPLEGPTGAVVVSLVERTITSHLDEQAEQRRAGRSAAALAATLAHEVRNPLSGIKGAAQLLEQGADAEDAALARIICDEVDRIGGLIDRVEAFGDVAPLALAPLNLHEVLDHITALSANGFAANAEIVRDYDPSLPAVPGNWDALVQVFLNLLKNAAEAVPAKGGKIRISTAFEHGLSIAPAGSRHRRQVPIAITIADNGAGIPEEAQPHLFAPFVTTKAEGSGLGLALVAKLVGDHGGIVNAGRERDWTEFRVLLPANVGNS